MIALILSISLVLWVLVKQLKYFYRMESYMKSVKSPYPIVPLLGNAYSLMGKSSTEVCNDLLRFLKLNGTPTKAYLGTTLIVTVDEPEDLKTILSSPYCYDKPFGLDFLPNHLGVFQIRCSCLLQYTIFRILSANFSEELFAIRFLVLVFV